MYSADPIRRCLCSLLCLGMIRLAIAQTDASAPAKRLTESSTPHSATHSTTTTAKAKTAKAKQQTSAHATTSHSSTHASTRTSTHSSTHSSGQGSSAQKSKVSHSKKNSKQVARKRGQQAIDSERAREIQTALIRERYMDGEPSGSWDSATQEAMQRYQADQGWQAKTTPDARALIKLGLGPSHDHLLNPESAMTTTIAPAADDPKAAAATAKPTPPEDNVPHP